MTDFKSEWDKLDEEMRLRIQGVLMIVGWTLIIVGVSMLLSPAAGLIVAGLLCAKMGSGK